MTIGVRRLNAQGLSTAVQNALFVPLPNSRRVACVVCGASGLPGCLWQTAHVRGHAPCLACGKQLTVKLDHHPRVHARCPKKAAA